MTRLDYNLDSRRHFLRAAIAVPPLLQKHIWGQSRSQASSQYAESRSRMTLAKEWNSAYLWAVSPGGDLLCLYSSKDPLTTFTFRGEQRTSERESPAQEVLAIVETTSWKSVFTNHLRARPSIVSFFADNQTVYLETVVLPPDFRTGERVLIDLRAGKIEERSYTRAPDEQYTRYYALNGRALLGIEADPNPSRAIALIRASLPDYKVMARAAYAMESVTPGDSATNNWGAVVSADRKVIASRLGHTIVLRRTEDLGVIWTRQIEPEFFGVWRLAITPNGTRITAAVLDFIEKDRASNDYVSVYDGKSGKSLAKLPVSGKEGLAISPDGRLLAIAKKLAKNKDIQLFIEVYEATTGRHVTNCLHDTVRPGKYQNLVASIDGIEFTADGKYLMTSGNNTVKAWQV